MPRSPSNPTRWKPSPSRPRSICSPTSESPWVAKIGNRGKGYETIAHFFVINRRYEEGIQYYRKAIAATPDLWSAHSQLGINLMRWPRRTKPARNSSWPTNNHFRDAATANTLTLMDSYKNFETFETPTTDPQAATRRKPSCCAPISRQR